MSEEKPKVELNVVQVVASALAAVSSAVLLSTVGVAGTIIGAAVGSVIATVGASIYAYSLRVSRERVTAAQAAAVARMSRVRTGTHTRTVELEDKPEDEGRAPWREALGRLPWKWVAIVSGGVFVVAMIIILGFELLTGHAVSDVTGGTHGAGHRTSLGFGSATTATHSPTPTPTPSPSASGSATPTTASPSGQATAPSATPGGPASAAPPRTPSVSSTPTTTAPTTTAPSSAATSSPTG
jgi:hypothetical protein